MPARVTLHFPDRPARIEILREGRDYVLGRDLDCDLALADERVSRRHALIAWTPAGWSFRDLESKNGSAVDGLPAGEALLGAERWLSLGGLLVHFRQVSAEEGEAEAAARLRRWRTSLARQRELAAEEGLPALLRRVLAAVGELVGAERGFVLLRRPDGELEVAATSGLEAAELGLAEFSGSAGAVERALASGAPVAANDVLADTGTGRLGARPSVLAGGIRALVCVPLRVLERTIGAVYADSRKPGAAFTELDVEILEALAHQAALAIAVARLDEELRGLADRLAAAPPAGGGESARLALDLEEARGRLRAPAGGATVAATWSGLAAGRGRGAA